jgi:ketosteroid isomerase-like protein
VSDATDLAGLMARLDALEAQVDIRALMAGYMHLCEHLDADTPMRQLGALFTPDAEWLGTGARHGTAFGAHRGRAAIVAMLDTYRSPPHFTFNAHYLTSERIEVRGDTALGRWLMLQASTYRDGRSDLRSAQLTVDFSRSEAGWQIARFATENLFSRPMTSWNDPTPIPIPGGIST